MAIAMETLLGELASELGELIPGVRINDNSLSGQATNAVASSSTVLLDVNNRFEYDENIVADSYLRVKSDSSITTNINTVVKIATYNAGTLTLTPGLNSINTNTQYQIFRRIHPSAYLQAITESLRLAYPSIYTPKADTTVTTAANTYVYTVPGDIEDVSRVELQIQTSPTSYPYAEINFEANRTGNDLQHIQLFGQYTPSLKLRISGAGYVTAPTSLLGTINVSGDEIEIVKMGAKAALYRKLASSSSDGSDDQNNFFAMSKNYYDLFLEAKAKHHKTLPRMTVIRDPRYNWL